MWMEPFWSVERDGRILGGKDIRDARYEGGVGAGVIYSLMDFLNRLIESVGS